MALLTATLSWSVSAQSAVAPGDTANSVSGTLRPALAQVGQSLGGVTIKRWKAPSEVRSAADQDVSSIQRDLNGTLAGLLQQADAAPGSVPAAFAVYRNVDALYDTLLRVVLTANLAAPEDEAGSLQAALATLESARGTLGQTILNSSQAQETELSRIRMAADSDDDDGGRRRSGGQIVGEEATPFDDQEAWIDGHQACRFEQQQPRTAVTLLEIGGEFRELWPLVPCLTEQSERGVAGIGAPNGRAVFRDSGAHKSLTGGA